MYIDTNTSSNPLAFEFTITASQYTALKDQQKKQSTITLNTLENNDETNTSLVLGRTFLRTTLRKYILQLGLTLEDIISLEYGPAVQPPRPSQKSWKTPDWITSIICGKSIVYSGLSNGTLLMGSINSYIQDSNNTTNQSLSSSVTTNSTLTITNAHNQGISSISLYETTNDQQNTIGTIATGGHDGIVRIWKHETNNNNTTNSSINTCEQQYELVGCADSCGGVAIDPTGQIIVGGDARGNILFWNTQLSTSTSDDIEDDNNKVGGKRSRSTNNKETNNDDTDFIHQPYFQANGRHNDRISGISWLSSANVASASWDHTIAIWDTEETRPVPITLLRCGKVITSITSSPLGSLLATSHPDHVIRIWDSRGRNTNVKNNTEDDDNNTSITTEAIGLKSTLLGQTSWINSVSWCHNSAYYVSGIGYNGIALLWDIRAPNTPLYTLDTHTDKGLCITWNLNDTAIISGGADGNIRFNNVQI